MKVGFRGLGEVKVDDDVDGLDIDTSREEVGADQVPSQTTSEIVEDSVSVFLLHSCVRVEARVANLCDFAREQFNSAGIVAEDDRLVDL